MLTTTQGHVLREMGLHAHLLEPRGSTPELLPLHSIPSESRSLGLQVALGVPHIPLCLIPICLLGLGYNQQPEEQIQAARARNAIGEKDIPPAPVADRKEPGIHQDTVRGFHLNRWVV